MFLKTFRTKSNTAIRGSDRRTLRADVGAAFPSLTTQELSEMIPNKEEMSVMRIVTHSGENVTVYCLKGEPIFFKTENKILPTVYTVWKKPNLMLQFTTWPPVFEKFQGGADLMLPGVVLPQDKDVTCFGRFEKYTCCTVNLKGNRAAVAVGVTLVSSRDLEQDGMRGKGVKILHTYLDNLWAQGSKINIPLIEEGQNESASEQSGSSELACEQTLTNEDPSLSLDNESKVLVTSLEEKMEMVKQELKDFKVADSQNGITQCGTTSTESKIAEAGGLNTAPEDSEIVGGLDPSRATNDDTTEPDEVLSETEKSPQEQMDDLLEYCFLCALLRIKKNDILPLLTSSFYKNYILPSCPEGSSVDIKKSSYKKLSKFLLSMQERSFIKVKELSKGVDSICEINWAHEKLKEFKASQQALVQPGAVDSSATSSSASLEGPKIEELYSVSGATVSIFGQLGYKKGDIFTAAEIRSAITNYVKSNELVDERNKKFVVLDPTLTKALINKHEDVERLQWDELFSRVLAKMNDCHRITLPGRKAVVRKGKIEAVEIKIEQRMGNKKVTLVNNLEMYGIDPQQFAHTLQIQAASSTSVSQLPGKHKTPGVQVMIQGKHVGLVATALLDDYKIPRKYVTGLELMKGGKKKK